MSKGVFRVLTGEKVHRGYSYEGSAYRLAQTFALFGSVDSFVEESLDGGATWVPVYRFYPGCPVPELERTKEWAS